MEMAPFGGTPHSSMRSQVSRQSSIILDTRRCALAVRARELSRTVPMARLGLGVLLRALGPTRITEG